jgi:hypothetical protein
MSSPAPVKGAAGSSERRLITVLRSQTLARELGLKDFT